MSQGILLFPGCLVAYRFPEYELAAVKVLAKLGVESELLSEAVCCGAYLRGLGNDAPLMAAYNLALAEETGKTMVTLCGGCSNMFLHSQQQLRSDERLRDQIQGQLRDMGLSFRSATTVTHILPFLYEQKAALEKHIVREFSWSVGIVHPCSVFRPQATVGTSYGEKPTIVRELCQLCGVEPIPYTFEYECCGASLYESHGENFMGKKRLQELAAKGVDAMVTACGNCQLFLERKQKEYHTGRVMPALFLPQLLALAMGYSVEELHIRNPRLRRLLHE